MKKGGEDGYMKLYNKSGMDWSEFQEISNTAGCQGFGNMIDLSDDGSILVTSDTMPV